MSKEIKYYRVSIPTKTYLKKFIIRYEGEQPVLDNSTRFRQFAFSLLEKSVIRDQDYRPKNLSEQGHTDKLVMLISERTFTHVGHSISLEKAMYINNFIKSEFDMILSLSVIFQTTKKNRTIRESLEAFCDAHEIEMDRDISLDNLIKIWHRTLPKIEASQQKTMSDEKRVTENILSPIPFVNQLSLF